MFLAALFHTDPHWKPHRRPASPIPCSCRRGSGGGPLCKSGRQMAPNNRRGGVSGREPGHRPARVHSLSPPPGQVSLCLPLSLSLCLSVSDSVSLSFSLGPLGAAGRSPREAPGCPPRSSQAAQGNPGRRRRSWKIGGEGGGVGGLARKGTDSPRDSWAGPGLPAG